MKVRKLTNPSSCSSWAKQTRGGRQVPIEDHWVTASAQDDKCTFGLADINSTQLKLEGLSSNLTKRLQYWYL